ncbi:MAG: hypothetical protein QXO39_04050 [Conexivisphaerales archaeon]
MIEHKFSFKTVYVNPRGTSECHVCGDNLGISKCETCAWTTTGWPHLP